MPVERMPLRLLVVMVHPHDFTHCAATCGVHVANGDQVTFVSLTGGAHTHNEALHDELIKPKSEQNAAVVDQSADQYIAQKGTEIKRVCALFGVTDVRSLGFPDDPFRNSPDVVAAIEEIIRETRPDVLIAQSPYHTGRNGMPSGGHDDHKEAAFVTIEAEIQASTPKYGDSRKPHTIAATYYPGVYFQPDEIDFFVDIAAWKNQRVQAEMLFESQGHSEAFARKRVEISSGLMGWMSGTGYAEGFVKKSPDVWPEIQVPEMALKRAREPHGNHLKRIAGELEE